jgi:hypothetical protein
LKKNDKYYLQGFYNAAFDDEFELPVLEKFIEKSLSEVDISEINENTSSENKKIIIEPEETILRIKSYTWKKKNDNDFNGDILFGFSPNTEGKYLTAIFTTEGIYNTKEVFISYNDKPEFVIKRGLLFKSLVDKISGFSIDLVALESKKIDLLLNYINYQIAEKES